MRNSSRLAVAVLSFTLLVVAFTDVAEANDESPASRRFSNPESITRWFEQHCYSCHSTERPKGELDLSSLAFPASGDHADVVRWQAVIERIESGGMPPPTVEDRPDAAEVAAVANQLRRRLKSLPRAEAPRRAVLRRLNRVEYENTLRDLLGVQVDVQDLLPQDSTADGFDNVAQAQHVSSFLLERYLEAADKALGLAIANQPRPPVFHKRLFGVDERQIKASTESVFRHDEQTLVMFSSSPWNALTVGQFYPPHRGQYRFRVRASAVQSGGRPVTFRVEAGPMLMGTKNHLIGYFAAPAGEPRDFTWTDHLEARSTIRLLPFGIANAQTVTKVGAETYDGPGLAVHEIEVEGPLYEAWPPACHRRIFGDLPQSPVKHPFESQRVEVVSSNEGEDARRILESFVRRAYRRPVAAGVIDPLLDLFRNKRDAGRSFEQAIRVALLRVLVSPDFLYFREQEERLDDFALASRLSYFLWSTMPDERLLDLAQQGSLSDADVLRGEVDRMLDDVRSNQFVEHFTGQWLKLRELDFTEPDRRIYPEFDDLLRTAMADETRLFFRELVREDLSLLNVVDSRFTMLNERLAKHYGIPGVTGHAMRRVDLPEDSHRGGVLTMANVLKVTANGTTTSPVVRGAFVMDRILGKPPAPPPEGVSAVEPDIRGATTIREQLARHRDTPACASCHREIDPPGFALESFDVIGGWREHYRSVGRGEAVTIEGRRMPYARGPAVEPNDVLADGRTFSNIDELKQLLLKDDRQIARAFTTRLSTYATGRAVSSDDRAQIAVVVERVAEKGYGLRSLIHELIQSPLFRER